MKLSEDLKECHDSGDFGNALQGYSERAKELEDSLNFISGWLCENAKYKDFKEIYEWGVHADNLLER